nr:MAG TPA: hypothetical protein [Bacteriophage sp.]
MNKAPIPSSDSTRTKERHRQRHVCYSGRTSIA